MPESHRSSTHRRLLILNAVLLGGLAAVSLAPPAGAQSQTPPRARGEYALVGGEMSHGDSNAVYVLDAANRELVALVWEDSRHQIVGIGYRDLANDLFVEPQR